MPAEFRGIEFSEYVGAQSPHASPRESFVQDGSRATRTFDIRWVDRSRAVREWLGYSYVDSAYGPSYIRRVTPAFHPDFRRATSPDQAEYLYAKTVDFVPLNPDFGLPPGESMMKSPNDVARYDKCRMTVGYETLTYDILTDDEMVSEGYVSENGAPDEATLRRYVTITSRPKNLYMSLPGAVMKYAGTDLPTGEPPGRVIPQWDLRITWHQVPEDAVPTILHNPNLRTIETLGGADIVPGKVNRYDWNGFAAGTLLCLAPEYIPQRSPRGDRIFEVHYFFDYFPLFHNRVPRMTGGKLQWVNCSTDGVDRGVVNPTNGYLIYDSEDFNLLFRAP